MKRELDTRTNAYGDRVSLVWFPETDAVELEIEDAAMGFVRSIPVPAACALDAFHHPYLYMPAAAALAATY